MRETETSSLSLKHRLTCHRSSAFIRMDGRKEIIFPCPGKKRLKQGKIPQLKVHDNISYIQVLKANALKDILRVVSHYYLNKNNLSLN